MQKGREFARVERLSRFADCGVSRFPPCLLSFDRKP